MKLLNIIATWKAFLCRYICISAKNIVILHPKWFTLGNVGGIVLIKNWEFWIKNDSPTRHDSFQDIIKRRLLALVLEQRNPENFSNPKQESDKCPLVCLIRCVLTTINISAWAFIVYSCYKVFQYLRLKNKQ